MPDLWAMVFMACMPNALTGDQCGPITIGLFEGEAACEVNRPMLRRVIAASLADQGYGAITLDEGVCILAPPPGEPV